MQCFPKDKWIWATLRPCIKTLINIDFLMQCGHSDFIEWIRNAQFLSSVNPKLDTSAVPNVTVSGQENKKVGRDEGLWVGRSLIAESAGV